MKLKLVAAISLVAIFASPAMAKTCKPEISVTGDGVDQTAARYDALLNWAFNAEQMHTRTFANWALANNQKVTFLKRKANKWTAIATAFPCK